MNQTLINALSETGKFITELDNLCTVGSFQQMEEGLKLLDKKIRAKYTVLCDQSTLGMVNFLVTELCTTSKSSLVLRIFLLELVGPRDLSGLISNSIKLLHESSQKEEETVLNPKLSKEAVNVLSLFFFLMDDLILSKMALLFIIAHVLQGQP